MIWSTFAALVQIGKNATELETKRLPPKQAATAPLMQYMTANPGLDGVFAAWDTAHKVRSAPRAQLDS